MKFKKIIQLLFIVFFGILFPGLISCSRNAVFEQSQATIAESWNKNLSLVFEGLEISDTTEVYNLSLIVRHTKSYPFSNLYLFMQTTFPDKRNVRDTIEITLAKPDGQWQGKGFGNLREYKLMLNDSLKFPVKGKYVFKLQQGMRIDNLAGIKDISVQIRKVSEIL